MAFKRKWNNPSGSRTYYAWRAMRSRCYDPRNPSFKHYGGRGIEVCPQWRDDFDQFVADMGEAPAGKSLDRIDNDLGYYPGNCRWATLKEQLNNQRRNRRITHNGKTQTLAQWAEELGLRTDTLAKRLERMPLERALRPGPLVEWRHGTRQGYGYHKCRCDLCREANNKRMRDRRARLKARHLLIELEGKK